MIATDLRELVMRVKRSDEAAFKSIFLIFQDAIYRFLLYKTRNADVAEDLLQEVFFKLWKVRDTLQENQSIKNYLYTIADNMVLNHIRHEKVVQRHQQHAPVKIFSNQDSPHFILEEKEWEVNMMRAIEALPEKARIVFLMSRMEDLSYAEIAERLSISVKTVEGHMMRALKLLRKSVSSKL